MDKYRKALAIDFPFYCHCGEILLFSDAHCGWWGYEYKDEITCKNCGQVWYMRVEAIPDVVNGEPTHITAYSSGSTQ